MGYVRDSRTFEPAPAVTLKGNWLAEAGFETGTPVDVQVRLANLHYLPSHRLCRRSGRSVSCRPASSGR
ncbi:SymE family type I addiction module toxin [Erwinia sp. S43]|uniref:SymE family type I addiction module toxin n=1 Tax=Erwinia sp. S43 TaxID=2769339 RepID=UPI00351C237F